MSVYSMMAMAHAGLGTLALVTYWSAGLAKKGSPLHKRAGKVYLAAMVGLLALAVPMTVQVWAVRGIVTGGFLAYLLVIVATTVWTAWRAIRDKRDWVRYTGTPFRVLMWANLASGIAIASIGVFLAQQMQLVIVAFSAIGIVSFVQMRRFARQAPDDPRWWLRQHLNAMLGNGVATHIAFLAIGLPRLLPTLQGPVFQNVAWLGPLAVSAIAGVWLTRKYLPARVARPAASARASGRGAVVEEA
jgi:hypothetical protein